MRLCSVATYLALANFIYQRWFTDAPDMRLAAERSFFQAVAVLCCWLVVREEE